MMRRKRTSRAKWAQIRSDYESGKSFRALAAEHGLSVGALHKRAKADNWARDRTPKVNTRATRRRSLSGIKTAGADRRRRACDAARTPLAYMLSVMNDPTVDEERRDDMARAAAQYCHPKADGGKKARQQRAAEEAGTDPNSEWGTDLDAWRRVPGVKH